MDDSSCSLFGPSHAILKVKVPLKVRVLAWDFCSCEGAECFNGAEEETLLLSFFSMVCNVGKRF